MTIGERIKYLRKKNSMTQTDIAKKLNIATQTIFKYEKDIVNSIPMENIVKLSDIFGVTPAYLMGWEDALQIDGKNVTPPIPYNPIIHKIPILGQIAAGLPLYAEEHIEGYTYTEHNGGAEYFALKVKGDSMNAALINDGSMIIVRRQPDVDNGAIAVVRVGKEDATVKRFRKDGNIVQLIPQSYNPEHQMQIYDLNDTEIEIIGRVVECKVEF